jgi:hypothetical protein
MTDIDELATLRAQLKRLERRQSRAAGEMDRTQRLLLARLLVVIATVAIFITVSMAWYADIEVPTSDGEESFESVSGWRILSGLAGADEGAAVFAGVYGWIVLLATLLAGASTFAIERRRFPITLSTLLALLACGLALVNLQESDDGEKLAGLWCAVILIAAGSFAWGNLATALREAERAAE